jgi:hypothetical protein
MLRQHRGRLLPALVACLWGLPAAAAPPPAEPPPELVRAVETAVAANDLAALAALRAEGPRVLPVMVSLYERADTAGRARLAQLFYGLGWRSPKAAAALMADVDTTDQLLRVNVQWALGRVSDDPQVVRTLLGIMRDDSNPLFRDKAACALAYDQIHLEPAAKVAMFAGLIAALDDPKSDVRRIALLALKIHTGQTKGFRVNGPPEVRRASIEAWRRWLEEYRANL